MPTGNAAPEDTVHTRLIALRDVIDSDVRAWQDLAEKAAEPNVYLDPRFLVPARDRGDEAADLRLVVVTQGGEWLAVLAVTTKAVAPHVPVRAATTGGTFMTTHSDRHHPLVRAGREVEALDALLHGLRPAGLPGLVQLQYFPADGPLADALAEVVRRGSMLVHERCRVESAYATRAGAQVDRRTEPADGPIADPPLAWGHMGAGRAKDFRRRVRVLAREAGGPLELHDVSADPGAEDEFVALQAAGWKGDAGLGGAALALDPLAQRWFREVVAGFRRDGDALALRLTAGGRTLFMSYGFRSGGSYFGFLDTFAEEFRKYSPGAVGRLAETAHVFAATDAGAVDPAFDARYVTGTQLYPDRRTYADLLVSTRGLVARTAVRAAPVAQRFGLGARSLVAPLVPGCADGFEQLAVLGYAVA
jgi:CelD/BcsL family acetyltransferase involved in cellulose biosynthesis